VTHVPGCSVTGVIRVCGYNPDPRTAESMLSSDKAKREREREVDSFEAQSKVGLDVIPFFAMLGMVCNSNSSL